ncbi:MAG: hypothetical protein LAO21_12075 [Acidobacteriia bacterium]|nr:hypothetical protein [Terriglobia bacterium]
MSEQSDERLRRILQKAVPPLERAELERDLWPEMLQKLDERPLRASRLDWVLAALVIAWLLLFPGAITVVLYQL